MKRQELEEQARHLVDALQLRDPIDRRCLLAEACTLSNFIYNGNGAAVAQVFRNLYPQMFHYGALRDHAAHLHTALDCPYPIDELILRLVTLPRLAKNHHAEATPSPDADACMAAGQCQSHADPECSSTSDCVEPPPQPKSRLDKRIESTHYIASLSAAIHARDAIDVAAALLALNHHIYLARIIDAITWEELDRAFKTIIARTPPDPMFMLTDP